MKHALAFEGGRELTFEVPEGATFAGLCATCARCDGPMPITRAVDKKGADALALKKSVEGKP